MALRTEHEAEQGAELESKISLLGALRRPGDEVQLTSAVAAVAACEPRFAAGLADLLVGAAVKHQPAARADLMLPVPETLTCRDESPAGRSAQGLLRRSKSLGRVDWLFTAEDFHLAVEVKLGAPFGHEQMHRYARGLPDVTRRGVLALTQRVPTHGEPDPDTPGWLGTVLWEQVLPSFGDLTAYIRDPDLGRQWHLFLEVLSSPGDVGLDPLDWESLAQELPGNRGRKRTARLLELVSRPLLDSLRDLLKARGAHGEKEPLARLYAGAQLSNTVVRLIPDGAQLGFCVPATAERPAIRLRVRGGALPLEVTTAFVLLEDPPLRPRRKRLYEQGLASLQEALFRPQGGELTRVRKLRQGDGTPVESLKEMVSEDLTAVVKSGALDVDLPLRSHRQRL